MELKINDLSLNYFGHSDCLHSISHTFVKGINVVFGEVGSGKTSLLKAIAGIEKPYEGRVELDGQPIGLSKESVVSFVFDDLGFFERRSFGYNLEYPLKLRKIPKSERREIVEGWLEKAGVSTNYLAETAFRVPTEERVKGALIRGFSRNSKIILLDNPLSGLNPSDRRKVFFELLKIAFENRDSIIIYATDSAEEARMLDCPTLVLSYGYVAGQGRIGELVENPEFITPSELLIPFFNVLDVVLEENGFDAFDSRITIDFKDTMAESFVGKKAILGFKPDAIVFGETKAEPLFEVNTDNGKVYLLEANGHRFYSSVCLDRIGLDENKIYIFDDVSGRIIYKKQS